MLRLGGCRFADSPPGTGVELRVSQIDLAAMSVMSRNTCNGILGRLVEMGLVSIGYRSIVLTEPGRLRALV